MTRGKRRFVTRASVMGIVLFLTAVLPGCTTTSPPPADDGKVDLEGTWLVTPGAATQYGAGGTTTLEFGPGDSGSAVFLSQSDANGITTCERHIYAALSDKVVLLDGDYYVAETAGADVLELDNGTDSLTLSRISGSPPVVACGDASAALVGTYAEGNGNFATLNAFESRLYFNIDDTNDSIVSFDTATSTFGPLRVYDKSVSGGVHRWVIAARSDDLFYGQCGCGGSESANAFDLSSDTSIAIVETGTDLGVEIGVRYGYMDAGAVVIGGRSQELDGVNQLLTLNADSLALMSQRQFLPEASVSDVALVDGDLIALVRDSIVFVGADGLATQTVKLEGLATGFPNGMTTVGSAVYVLEQSNADESLLYHVTLP